ncbi:MAG: SLBB domain-containing protein [bacterium]
MIIRDGKASALRSGWLWLIVIVGIMSATALAQKGEEVRYIQVEPEPEPPPSQLYLDKAINPETYIVGPGDRFLITFYGVDIEPIEVEILPEGAVSIPTVGEVWLGQITLAEAKERIRTEIGSRFRGRDVGVSLSRVRMFKVSVTGGVEKPGAVVVSGSDRVTDALLLAGGLAQHASQRNIRLMESPGDTILADVARFNATGDIESNPYLHEGQVIFVPFVSDSLNTVEIYGAVNQPDIFEFRAGDRISDLLALGHGPAVDAELDTAELARFLGSGNEQKGLTVNLREIIENPGSPTDLLLQPDDRLFVRAIAGYHRKEEASIDGEVRYPGVYPIENGCRMVSELIARAGGLLENASLSEAEMLRQSRWTTPEVTSFDQLLQVSTETLTDFELQYLKTSTSGQPRKVAVNFPMLLGKGRQEYDIPLRDGDRIEIPPKSYVVTVLGRVVNPGQVPFKEDQTTDYYIRLAGGYGYKADKKNIRIVKANTGSLVKPEKKSPVQMGDRIMVPQTRGTDWWGLIKDAGLFLANVATIYVVVDQAVN